MKRQTGMALLVVLMLLALMMLMATSISERWFLTFQRALYDQNQLQGKWYALGAEDIAARLLLQAARDDGQHTHLAQYWANANQVFPVEEAQLRTEITDAQACFNINALGQTSEQPNENTASYPVQVLRALLHNLEIEDYQANPIVTAAQEWIGEKIPGTQDEYYAALNPPYLAAHQPMQDISELRLIRGVTPELLQRMRPLLCALPNNKLLININTLTESQAALLAAMTLNRIDPAAARHLIKARPHTGWQSPEDFLALPTVMDTPELPAQLHNVLSVNSAYFSLRTLVRFEESDVILHSLLQRQDGKVVVIRRHRDIMEE